MKSYGLKRVRERQIEGEAPMPYYDVEEYTHCICPSCYEDGHWVRIGGSSDKSTAEAWTA